MRSSKISLTPPKQAPAKVPQALYLMMSLWSWITLESMLKLLNHDSRFSKSLLQEIRARSKQDFDNLLAGINKYHRALISYTPLKRSAQLIKFSKTGIPLLIIPSLINRSSILDLKKENSFCKELVSAGFAPYLVDWGELDEFAKTQDIMGYLKNILLPLLTELPSKFVVMGYCMGGFMGLLLEKLIAERVLGYITLATPWDFSVNNFKMSKHYKPLGREIPGCNIQMLFYLSNPFDINRKFIGFNNGHYNEAEFLEIEHWVNDTPDVSAHVFNECIEQFYNNNSLLNSSWRGLEVEKFVKPSLIILGKKDKIVPYQSGLALHQQLANSTLFSIDSGHIGLILNKKKVTIDAIKTWYKTFLAK